MTTLYATDLDGTLLDPTAHLSKDSAEMINELKDKGALISFITARTPATIEPILSDALPNIPGVAMTGAALWNPSTRLYEVVRRLSADDAIRILDICGHHGVTPFVITLPGNSNVLVAYHAGEYLSGLERQFVTDRSRNGLKVFRLNTDLPADSVADVVLLFAMGEPRSIRLTAEDITASTGCSASWYPDTYHPGVSLLEVFAPGVSKASGLHMLRERVGAERVVAFGDNLNDIPMLLEADVAVAVENAHPEVKAVADVVIEPSYTDSVMHFIYDDFMNY